MGSIFKSEYMLEFDMASRQVTALAHAMPADSFEWRPCPGVRSAGEVYVHIAETNVRRTSLRKLFELHMSPGTNGEPSCKPTCWRTYQMGRRSGELPG